MRIILKRVLGLVAVALVSCVPICAQQAACAAKQPTNSVLERLQGTWEGVMLGHESSGKITITVSSNSFHFHRDEKFWFDTTIVLPPGTNPQQLHATIKRSAASQGDETGQVVFAILKIEDGTLTLATGGDAGADKAPANFDDEKSSRYELRKVPPAKKDLEPPKPK